MKNHRILTVLVIMLLLVFSGTIAHAQTTVIKIAAGADASTVPLRMFRLSNRQAKREGSAGADLAFNLHDAAM